MQGADWYWVVMSLFVAAGMAVSVAVATFSVFTYYKSRSDDQRGEIVSVHRYSSSAAAGVSTNGHLSASITRQEGLASQYHSYSQPLPILDKEVALTYKTIHSIV
eukprot:Gregarina_sp_Poly_1__1430@NODE_1357_length_4305_cov_171_765691_g13_i1_p6_GENE_NODE_1357_length_4305_cov_171_765691_g13_i1NODE_1357_length_4305_cov_171_765691_g13_i1_p6_ORF_typecomplete_len105_score11_06TB2_DP1_HVA22/PF03134_19/0_68TB2_DP1_HVA22/PF03134_19/7_1e03_NODE_1357_length_4305_cov_171_765691_g13_i118892203